MRDMKNDTIHSVKIIHRQGSRKGRVAVEFELTVKEWAWMEELEDRRMIPLVDMLYSGFIQGMEKEGWKNPANVTTPNAPPPRNFSLLKNAPDDDEEKISEFRPKETKLTDGDLDEGLPF